MAEQQTVTADVREAREDVRRSGEMLRLSQAQIIRRMVQRTLPTAVPFTILFTIAFLILGRPWQLFVTLLMVVYVTGSFLAAYWLLGRTDRPQLPVLLVAVAVDIGAFVTLLVLEQWGVIAVATAVASIVYVRLGVGRDYGRLFAAFSVAGLLLSLLLLELHVLPPYPIPSWLRFVIWTAHLLATTYITVSVLEMRDAWYGQALQRLDAYARELDAHQATVEQHTRELEKRARYFQAIAEVAREAAVAQLDLRELLSRVAHVISEQFGFYHTGIFLLDPTKKWAVLQAASSEGGQRMLARGHRLRVGEQGTVGYVTSRGIPRVALDVGEDAVFFSNPDLPETRSAMTLPLIARGEIIGALDVQSKEPAAFTDEDVAMIQVMADQVALAISNARLLEQVERSLEAARLAYGEASLASWREMLKVRPLMGYRYESDVVVPLEQVVEEASDESLPTLILPITTRGQPLGVLEAHKSAEAGAWTEEEIALMRTLVEQLEMALDSARLYQDTQRRAYREQVTRQIMDEIRSAVTIEDAIRRAIQSLSRVLEASEMAVRLGAGTSAEGAEGGGGV